MPSPVISLETIREMVGLGQPIPWENFTPVTATGGSYASLGNPFVSKTILTTPTKIFSSYATYPVSYVVLSVRSIGTSTWCRVGNVVSQVQSLLSATDSIIIAAPVGEFIDAAQLFGVSSNGDVTLEVTPMLGA